MTKARSAQNAKIKKLSPFPTQKRGALRANDDFRAARAQ
jgi:hypothetical protein